MQTIQIAEKEHQRLVATLGGQQVIIEIRTIGEGLYFSLMDKDSVPIVSNTLAQPFSRLVRMAYTGFIGDFMFIPEGNVPIDDVITFDKLSVTYQLVYDETGEFGGLGDVL